MKWELESISSVVFCPTFNSADVFRVWSALFGDSPDQMMKAPPGAPPGGHAFAVIEGIHTSVTVSPGRIECAVRGDGGENFSPPLIADRNQALARLMEAAHKLIDYLSDSQINRVALVSVLQNPVDSQPDAVSVFREETKIGANIAPDDALDLSFTVNRRVKLSNDVTVNRIFRCGTAIGQFVSVQVDGTTATPSVIDFPSCFIHLDLNNVAQPMSGDQAKQLLSELVSEAGATIFR
ncbi:MAG TPA: hypothetical protein VGV39_04515 [Mesorhizobium sp.]|jgi:hypothetical protein|uniref:hypothetical protein n=1 Tax=Mesorhizobium sp. TaxID=1871066 RepID=UPI002DDD1732|nr:hypothetical protein [Mesorhizobium sp.]HEV2502311.1 hypothetical protein [Mesorhizobium sp.]